MRSWLSHFGFKGNQLYLTLIVFTIAFVYAIAAWKCGNIYLSDSFEYVVQASNILNHQSSYCNLWQQELLPEYWSLRTPLYACFLSFWYIWSCPDHLIVLYQLLVQAVAFLWLYRISDNRSKKFFAFFVITLVLSPVMFISAGQIMSDWMFAWSLFIAIYFIFMFEKNHGIIYLLLYNFMLCVAVLIKPVLLYFFVINFIIHLYIYYNNKNKLVLALSILMPLVILFWSMRNEKLTGVFHYTYMTTNNLYNYNARLTLEHKFNVEYADSAVIEWRKESLNMNFHDKCLYLNKKASSTILEYWHNYIMLQVRGMAKFWLDPGRYDIVNFLPQLDRGASLSFFYQWDKFKWTGMKQYIVGVGPWFILSLFCLLIFNIIFIVAVICSCKKMQKSDLAAIVSVVIIMYIWIMTGPIGNARFKLAVLPISLWLIGKYLWTTNRSQTCNRPLEYQED